MVGVGGAMLGSRWRGRTAGDPCQSPRIKIPLLSLFIGPHQSEIHNSPWYHQTQTLDPTAIRITNETHLWRSEFEFQIGLANMDMAPEVETVFLLTEPKNIFVSSSLVREIATNGGDVSRYLPEPAYKALMSMI